MLSTDAELEAQQFGKWGRRVVYSMLSIEVERPGYFPDVDSLDKVNILDSINPAFQFMKPIDAQKPPGHMNPQDIFYIQDSIASRFQCGRSVRDTMQRLMTGTLSPSQIPAIRVFKMKGKWHTEDNRRLWAFKEAGLTSVPVKETSESYVDSRKFTTMNGGVRVRMRG